MRRAMVVAAWVGLVSLEGLTARTYLVRGTWWHWLLHIPVGWGVGLAVAAVVAPRWPVALALLGQLASMVPDLMFRFMRMPHTGAMDLWLGHISVHTGPSPVLVCLGVLLLGGWGWLASAAGHRVVGSLLAAGSGGLLLTACLLAAPLPSSLSQIPR